MARYWSISAVPVSVHPPPLVIATKLAAAAHIGNMEGLLTTNINILSSTAPVVGTWRWFETERQHETRYAFDRNAILDTWSDTALLAFLSTNYVGFMEILCSYVKRFRQLQTKIDQQLSILFQFIRSSLPELRRAA